MLIRRARDLSPRPGVMLHECPVLRHITNITYHKHKENIWYHDWIHDWSWIPNPNSLSMFKASVWLFCLLIQCQSQYGTQFCQEWAAAKNISLLWPSEKVLTKAIIPTASVLHCLLQQAKWYLLQICPCPHNILRDATCFGHCGSRRSHPVASQSCYEMHQVNAHRLILPERTVNNVWRPLNNWVNK